MICAPFFIVVTTFAVVLGAARTFAEVTLIFAITGAGVGVAGGCVGNGVGGGRVLVAREIARVGVRVGPNGPPPVKKIEPAKRTAAQRSKTTAPMASGIHSRLGPPSGEDRSAPCKPPPEGLGSLTDSGGAGAIRGEAVGSAGIAPGRGWGAGVNCVFGIGAGVVPAGRAWGGGAPVGRAWGGCVTVGRGCGGGVNCGLGIGGGVAPEGGCVVGLGVVAAVNCDLGIGGGVAPGGGVMACEIGMTVD